MAKQLTENEEKALRFIYDHGRPTYREIADEVGLADVTSAVYVVNSLIKKNLLKKTLEHASRSLKITEEGYLQLHSVFVGDLKKWLATEKIKISFPQELKVSGVATPQQLSTNYWQTMGADGTEIQEMPDVIKTAVSFLLSHPVANGTSKDFLNAEKIKGLMPLLYSSGMLSTFCWAIIFSIVILPASLFILKENWLTGFVIISIFLILANALHTKR